MRIEYTSGGIWLPEIDLWLDSTQSCRTTWISHGHSDHAGGDHATVIGTPLTLRFYQMRWASEYPAECRPLEYGESLDFHGARLTAYPAAHILGAAQLLVEYRGERVVYTGDIKLREPLSGAATEVVPCDRLIVESTFGLPIFRFLDRDTARERIVRFARECFEDGLSPAYLGYPLGRGQEIVHVLCSAAIPTMVHGAIARYTAEYGIEGWRPYDARGTEGHAVVVTPGFRNVLEASGKYRVAYVSGWAAMDNARDRAGAEELIPYSDHGDFTELLELVERTGAREIDVVHGYTEAFAKILRSRGLQARAPSAAASRDDETE